MGLGAQPVGELANPIDTFGERSRAGDPLWALRYLAARLCPSRLRVNGNEERRGPDASARVEDHPQRREARIRASGRRQRLLRTPVSAATVTIAADITGQLILIDGGRTFH